MSKRLHVFYNPGAGYVAVIDNLTLKKVYFTLDEFEGIKSNFEVEVSRILHLSDSDIHRVHKIRNRNFRPYISYVVLTGNCNLACEYCYIEPIARRKSMGIETAQRVLTTLNTIKPEKVVFYGGEPLTNKDVLYYFLENLDNTIKKQIITNGTLVDREFAEKVYETNTQVSVSLDGGFFDNIHRIYPKGEKAFYDTLQGIAILKAQGVNVNISATIHIHNVYRLPDIVDFFHSLGIKGFGFNIMLRTGYNDKLSPDPKTTAYFLYKAMNRAIQLGMYEDRSFRRLKAFLEERFKFFDCPWIAFQAIDFGPDGNIGGCQAFVAEGTPGFVFSNISDYKKSLEKIRNVATINYEKCLSCPALGICGGVCPYHALLKAGKVGIIDNDFCKFVNETLKYLIHYYYRTHVDPIIIDTPSYRDFPSLVRLCNNLKETSKMSIRDCNDLATSFLKMKELETGIVVIARDLGKNAVVGFANLVFKDKNTVELGIGVHSNYRRKGLGSRLLDYLLKQPDKRLRIYAETFKGNVAVRKLLEKKGFKLVSKANGRVKYERLL